MAQKGKGKGSWTETPRRVSWVEVLDELAHRSGEGSESVLRTLLNYSPFAPIAPHVIMENGTLTLATLL